jgi:hypothetical protein
MRITKFLSMAILLILVGCESFPPGTQVDASAVERLILRYYGHEDAPMPTVFVVEDQGCAGPAASGFEDGGACRGGFTNRPESIFIARPKSNRWSDTGICHETMHWIGLDHPNAADWPEDSPIQMFITQCRWMLRTQGEPLDVVPVPEKSVVPHISRAAKNI